MFDDKIDDNTTSPEDNTIVFEDVNGKPITKFTELFKNITIPKLIEVTIEP